MCEGEKTRRKKEKKRKRQRKKREIKMTLESEMYGWKKKKKRWKKIIYIKKKRERNLMSQYCYNFSQKILNSRLLSTITTGKKLKKKTNLCGMFKLKPVTTYYLRFVLKILWS